MLWVVLQLVLGSFGLLITALITSNTSWAWASVGASVVAAGLLIADWMRRRAAQPVTGHEPPVEPLAGWDGGDFAAGGDAASGRPTHDRVPTDHHRPAGDRDVPGDRGGLGESGRVGDRGGVGDGGRGGGAVAQAATTRLDPAVEPAEESTDVTDAIAVSELADEVRVIDERPRYHLAGCRWVGERETIPLPVAEARELGFTPCAICTPDSRLATARRTARR